MTMQPLNFDVIHPSWQPCFDKSLKHLDPTYLQDLSDSDTWLPGPQNIFNAFSMPLNKIKYVLIGESPYPRRESANGYAFWDAAVTALWSPDGMSKKVNRATSFRNFLKMLLVAEGLLDPSDTSQGAISQLDKNHLVQTNDAFFHNMLAHGFLLLNATLVLQPSSRIKEARIWYPFLKETIDCLLTTNQHVRFILFGRIANDIEKIIAHRPVDVLYSEHPYNHSFITNPAVIQFFKPLHLLKKLPR